jgi:glutamine amidotransferase-like uncharacterized protein
MKKLQFIIFFLSLFSLYHCIAFAHKEKKVVYVYKDEGVSHSSLSQTLHMLKKVLPAQYQIKTIHAEAVIANQWSKDAALFIMPGGADLPYAKKLDGLGNQNIKAYVRKGGAYLGICAGAYYGSAYVEFDKGGNLEVSGKRELAFFPGKAIGPILAQYDYSSQRGARAAKISLKLNALKASKVYYNGGGYFESPEKYPNTTVLGRYQNGLSAIVYMSYGKGRVILSGPHFEYDPTLLDDKNLYLKTIIKSLKTSNTSRALLVKELLKKLKVE